MVYLNVIVFQLLTVLTSSANLIGPNNVIHIPIHGVNETLSNKISDGLDSEYPDLTSAEYFSNELISDAPQSKSLDHKRDDVPKLELYNTHLNITLTSLADGNVSHVVLQNIDLDSDKATQEEIDMIVNRNGNGIGLPPKTLILNLATNVNTNDPSNMVFVPKRSDTNSTLKVEQNVDALSAEINLSHDLYDLNNKVKREQSDQVDTLNSTNKNTMDVVSQDNYRKLGQTSLVIVFDGTGSMTNCLVQLRHGAKLIIDKFANSDANPIYNYVFVPFRDPGL